MSQGPDEFPEDFALAPRGAGEGPQAGVDAVLAELDRELAGRKYYDLIPDEDKEYFDGLVRDNKGYYPDMKLEDLREMLAKNYLARIRAFESIVTQRGFTPATEATEGFEVAGLTRSGSYIFMSEEVFTDAGGSFHYFKIDGRKTGGNNSFEVRVCVRPPVRVGSRVQLMPGASIESTSTLKKLFVRRVSVAPAQASILDVSVLVRNATMEIDSKTMMELRERENS